MQLKLYFKVHLKQPVHKMPILFSFHKFKIRAGVGNKSHAIIRNHIVRFMSMLGSSYWLVVCGINAQN